MLPMTLLADLLLPNNKNNNKNFETFNSLFHHQETNYVLNKQFLKENPLNNLLINILVTGVADISQN